MPDTPIQPALTPAEWRTETAMIRDHETPQGYGFIQGGECFHIRTEARGVFLSSEKRHALAALALHGQPFGFTREDVANLRDAAEWFANDGIQMFNLDALADRLAALLPPE